jgi:hypothetical protein
MPLSNIPKVWLLFAFGAVACENGDRVGGGGGDVAEAGKSGAGRDGSSGESANSGESGAGGAAQVGGATGTGGAGAHAGSGGAGAEAGNVVGASGGMGARGETGEAGTGGEGTAAGSGAGGTNAGTGGLPWPVGPAACVSLDDENDAGSDSGDSGAARLAAVGATARSTRGVAVPCTISVEESLGAVPTVGIVSFSVSGLSDISRAQIDFYPVSGGRTLTAPVDLTSERYRTLLLGMKGATRYAYRIAVTGSTGTCTSPEYTITTGPVPADVKPMNVTFQNAGARAQGFIVASTGFAFNGPIQREHHYVYIVDTDGDPVWWAVLPGYSTSARMSFDAREVYVNVGAALWSVSLEDAVARDLELASHHDVTALPDGGLATFDGESLIEREADGTVITVVPDVAALYGSATEAHLNALHYYAWDDSYTVSALFGKLFLKITRQGELVWQLGGIPPADPSKHFAPAQLIAGGNHGHQLMPDGTFVFFNNYGAGCGLRSGVLGFELDPRTRFANALFAYGLGHISEHLGDVQRLPNGNYLMTSSERGQFVEFTPAGEVVARLETDEVGYVEFRESLYGPPLY